MLFELIRYFGIKFREKDFENEKFAGMLVKRRNHWFIVVNEQHSPDQKRFTIAHELGHYVQHKEQQSNFFDDKDLYSNSPLETEANVFASELLIPEQVLVSMLDVGFGFYHIAEQIGVSKTCLKWRLVRYIRENSNLTVKQAEAISNQFRSLSDNNRQYSSLLFRLHSNRRESAASFFGF